MPSRSVGRPGPPDAAWAGRPRRGAGRWRAAAALAALGLGGVLAAGSGAAAADSQAAGSYNAMVVFAKFRDEAPGTDTAPSWSPGLFDRTRPGSFAHFYEQMSGGRLRVGGQVLPRRYSSRDPAAAYLAPDGSQLGDFGRFNLEILTQADADTDFGQFDNDGPDGVPNSGDDDGYVDIVFVNLLTVPRYFLLDRASGYASLGLDTDYLSDDPAAGGGVVRVRSRFGGFGGTTQRGHTFSVTAATMCHEFGHVLGLVDLFDQSTIGADGTMDPAEDSAGVGKWCLMGLGTPGWGVEDGPNAFCAWSLARLGWVQVVDVTADTDGLVIPDALAGRRVFRIPLTRDEYYLLENRQASGSYYNRNVPASGLLIWHVDERADNDEERHKQVDLVCADGLYADTGYPGLEPDPVTGGDNLDYFAKDSAYATAHRGNEGDATDPFDGVQYTRFAWDTNPRAAAYTGLSRNLPMGIAVDNIRARGADMVVDVRVRQPLAGHVTADTTWSGTVDLASDVVVDPGVQLTLGPGTTVRLASFDWSRQGLDEALCELLVYGELVPRGTAARPVTLESSIRRGRWLGLYLMDGQGPDLSAVTLSGSASGVVRLRLPPGQTRWRDTIGIPADLVVPQDAELVVEPGTTVQFGMDATGRGVEPQLTELTVEGRLTVAGDAGDEVTFGLDPTVGDAVWYGIAMAGPAHVDIRHLSLELAAFGLIGTVDRAGSLAVADSRFSRCGVNGLRLTVNGAASVARTVLTTHRQQGLRVDGSGELVLDDVEVTDNGREGVLIGNAAVRARGLRVERNGVLDAADPRAGVVALGGRGQTLRLEQVEIADNRLHGLALDSWEGSVQVEGAQVTGNAGDGVRVHASPWSQFVGVAAAGNGGAGLSLRGGASRLDSVSLAGNTEPGVVVGPGGLVELCSCTFTSGAGLALEAADSVSVVLSRFATGATAVAADSTPVLLRHNRFEDNQTALLVRGGPPLPAPVERNVFLRNALAIDNRTDTTLVALANYWGTSDSSAVAAQMQGPVRFIPLLTSEPDPTAVTASGSLPAAFALGAPYPNPGNGQILVPFAGAGAGPASLVLYDVLGRPVRHLRAWLPGVGGQVFVWDGRADDGAAAASGLYLLRLTSGRQTACGRLVLAR